MAFRTRASRVSPVTLIGCLLALAPLACAARWRADATAAESPISLADSAAVADDLTPLAAGKRPSAPQAGPRVSPRVLTAPDSARFDAAARLAWKQFNTLWQPRTGLANATLEYGKLTSWDMGSVLAALHSARVLGLLDEGEYRRRMSRSLRTISTLPLYRGITYHRMYSATKARMTNRSGGITTRGYGWSATDVGRLLLWLGIVADADPHHSALAKRAAMRVRLDSIVDGGYLHGEDVGASGKRRRFQEGRIGYEQYSARGFARWGADVAPALDVLRNARPLALSGASLLEDARGLDRLVSEPFFLTGLELGWTGAYRDLALEVLRAQEERASEIGKLLFTSEDAVSVAPYYFYYYCVYCSGKPFVIEVSEPGKTVDHPKWMSTKTVFAWHALIGSDYTRRGLEAIQAASDQRRGWSSGLFENTGRATGTYDVNTAAIVLEAAAYVRSGRPLAEWRAGEPPVSGR